MGQWIRLDASTSLDDIEWGAESDGDGDEGNTNGNGNGTQYVHRGGMEHLESKQAEDQREESKSTDSENGGSAEAVDLLEDYHWGGVDDMTSTAIDGAG